MCFTVLPCGKVRILIGYTLNRKVIRYLDKLLCIIAQYEMAYHLVIIKLF